MSAELSPNIEPPVGIVSHTPNKWSRVVTAGAVVMAGVTAPAFEGQPAAADTTQVVIGMPFDGKWAYSDPTTAGCGSGSSQTSHPSCHEIYVGDWSTDLYGPAGTDVKLRASSGESLSFAWDAASGTCGETRRVKVYANGTYVGRVHFTHLSGAASTNTAPTNGMTIGQIANLSCNPGGSGKHTHVEFDNANSGTYSCYVNYSNASNTAGIPVGAGSSIGVLGSTNTGPKQACASVPTSGGGTPGPGTTTMGAYNPNTAMFYLRNSNTPGNADLSLLYGNVGLKPVVGDWDGDGDTTLGSYDPNTATFHLRDSNTQGPADGTILYGNLGWIPIAGDWDGNGTDTIGAYEPATGKFYLRNSNTPGNADYPPFQFGNANAGWLPLAGDWDGNGITSIGIYNPTTATFYLRNANNNGPANYSLVYGAAGWTPIAGDWDGQ
jgi:hypothetical protein